MSGQVSVPTAETFLYRMQWQTWTVIFLLLHVSAVDISRAAHFESACGKHQSDAISQTSFVLLLSVSIELC